MFLKLVYMMIVLNVMIVPVYASVGKMDSKELIAFKKYEQETKMINAIARKYSGNENELVEDILPRSHSFDSVSFERKKNLTRKMTTKLITYLESPCCLDVFVASQQKLNKIIAERNVQKGLLEKSLKRHATVTAKQKVA